MNLKEVRISKKLNQTEASNICGVSIRTYKRLENDNKYLNSGKYLDCVNKLNQYESNKNINDRCKIIIIGAGYVGYSLATVLKDHNEVILVDSNVDRVNKLNKESNIKAILPNNDIYLDKDIDFIFICVPTNYDENSGLLDTSIVKEVINNIRYINNKVTIVIKSTCNIGFTSSLNDHNTIYCPEFFREKTAIDDMRRPSRIIIGCDNMKNNKIKKLNNLLLSSVYNHPHSLIMTSKEAEAVKLFSNAYLAMRVAYFNELDSFANDNDINTNNVINGVSLDPRIGDYYNKPSTGYSGKCLPKDTLALSHLTNSDLISSIHLSNEKRKKRFK